VIALVLNALVLGGLLVLFGAAIAALREGFTQKLRPRPRGLLLVAGVALLTGVLIVAVLI
jgi:hypothetical protein